MTHPTTTIVHVDARLSGPVLDVVLTTNEPALRAESTVTVPAGAGPLVRLLAAELGAAITGREVETLTSDIAATWRLLRNTGALAGPLGDDRVGRAALAVVVNAIWDLWARVEGVPLWQLVAALSPERLVAAVDLAEIGDVLPGAASAALLRPRLPGKVAREAALRRAGYPAALQLGEEPDGEPGLSAGVALRGDGHDRKAGDERICALARRAVSEGWDAVRVRLHPGASVEEDRARVLAVREVIGANRRLLVDAAGAWSPLTAPDHATAVADAGPVSIDDPVPALDAVALGRVREALPAEIDLVVGHGVHRATIFKQLLVRRIVDAVRPDPASLGGVNETLAVLLLAARYNTPACPTSDGNGPSAAIAADLAFVDYISIGASLDRIAVVPADLVATNSRADAAVIERGRLVALPEPAPIG